jgi:acyl-CoA synthetase (AMP-forming)/AMP-acid ligase II
VNSFAPAPGASADATPEGLGRLLDDLPFSPADVLVHSDHAQVTLGELRRRIAALAETLAAAGLGPGQPVGCLVPPGPASLVVMFAVWRLGAVYVPINGRFPAAEVATFVEQTPVAAVVGSPAELARIDLPVGLVEHDFETASSRVHVPARGDGHRFGSDIALVLRTSGTTGPPKAVLLRHTGTLTALDASLAKLRRRQGGAPAGRARRMNLIPVSLALWAGIFNSLFSLRAGFGLVLLDRFTPAGFASAVRAHDVRSTVLAPAMLTMLVDDPAIEDLGPLRLVRSITAPLSPEVARRFHDRFGAFVLNSYGQTELGGEVVGWTTADLRSFGETKLGAAGRPYDHVDLRVRRDDGSDAEPDELGEIFVHSPFRMSGYAKADGAAPADDRFVDGYLRTGDIGRLDHDGFLWIEGRASDVINRGGLKVFPDEVEEVLRRHPSVRDAGVAAVADRRLGEVPHAWIVSDEAIPPDELRTWCRDNLAPYKVPASFHRLATLPRSDIGKLLRRDLRAEPSE